ncbi:MAG: hypothetical protein IKU94_08040 [Bacteroidaceae bacterium]|nr:hypothetical protein [Bacteroidaceae bacterium]
MKCRCENPNATNFSDYGGRGITICSEWKENFGAFYEWAMSQGYDPDAKRGQYTVDRIDNSKGYSPENCRLASSKEQANNRRNTRFVTVNGICKSTADWARYYGRNRNLFTRLSDDEIEKRISAYEAYKQKHGVDNLPKRVNA